jgi:hypothetical protein
MVLHQCEGTVVKCEGTVMTTARSGNTLATVAFRASGPPIHGGTLIGAAGERVADLRVGAGGRVAEVGQELHPKEGRPSTTEPASWWYRAGSTRTPTCSSRSAQ